SPLVYSVMRSFIHLTTLILALGLVVSAQTANQTSSSSVVKEAQPQNATEVLARARQLYAGEGPKPALPEFEKALALFHASGDKKNEAITIGLIGNCYKKLAEYSKAEDFLQRALSLKRTIGDRLEEAKTLSHLGLLHWDMGDFKLAAQYLNQSIAIAAQLQDRVMEAAARNNLGLVLDEIGNYRQSTEQYSRALELYRAAQSQSGTSDQIESGIGDAVGNLGGDYLLLGDYGNALKSYQQAL